MSLVGPSGLFAWAVLAGAVLAAFAIYRARIRPQVPASAKTPAVVSPRTTPAVTVMATDISGAEPPLESDEAMMAAATEAPAVDPVVVPEAVILRNGDVPAEPVEPARKPAGGHENGAADGSATPDQGSADAPAPKDDQAR
jgi:hypothetical protein